MNLNLIALLLPVFMAAVLGFGCYWYHVRLPAFSMGLNIWYPILTGFMSATFLDSQEIYITELQTFSVLTFYSGIYLIYSLLIVLGFVIPLKIWQPEISIPRVNVGHYAAFGMLTLVFVLQASNLVLSKELPILGAEVRRFDYWDEAAYFSWLPSIFGTTVFFFPMVSLCLAFLFNYWGNQYRIFRNICIGYLVLYFIYLFCTGQRFNGFLLPGLMIYAIFWNYSSRGLIFVRMDRIRILAAQLLGLFVLIGLIDLLTRDVADVVGAGSVFAYRIFAIQSATFWGAIDHFYTLGVTTEFGLMDVLLRGSSVTRDTLLSAGVAEQYERIGINLSGAITGTAILHLGFIPAVFVSFFYGAMSGLSGIFFLNDLFKFRIVSLFISSMMLLSCVTVFSRGGFEEIFSFKFAILIGAYGGLSLARSSWNSS